jgi:hypothetical protein
VQAHNWMADGLEHPLHLMLASFVDHELNT